MIDLLYITINFKKNIKNFQKKFVKMNTIDTIDTEKYIDTEKLYDSLTKLDSNTIMRYYIKNINFIYSGEYNNKYLYKIEHHEDKIESMLITLIKNKNKEYLLEYVTHLNILQGRWSDPYFNIIYLSLHHKDDEYTTFIIEKIDPLIPIGEVFAHDISREMIKYKLFNSLKCFNKKYSLCKNIFSSNVIIKNYVSNMYDCGNGALCICE